MQFIDIPLKHLTVNPNNDRHGPKGDEQKAIAWLFAEHRDKMLSLAKDIVDQGAVFDAPLVKEENGKYVVYDGNRRVTCLKVLCGFINVPKDLQIQFSTLKNHFECSPEMTLTCQLEQNQDVIDQIVSRRHNGTDGGRGQLGWDTRAKQNHATRIGKTTQYPIAEAVENFLEDNGYPLARELKRSTLFRLLSAKKRQKIFGIALKADGTLDLSREKSQVMESLVKVADDIVENRLTLKNLLNSEGVEEYIDKLIESGFLENTDSDHVINIDGKSESGLGKTKTTKLVKKRERESLIPKTLYEIEWPHGLHKAEKIWEELQYSLNFKRHAISIPIAFRVLVEVLTDYANGKTDNPKNPKEKLSARVRHVASHFHNEGHLAKKEREDLERLLGDTRSPRELEVLHRCVHGRTTLPAKDDLIALWTAFEHYLVRHGTRRCCSEGRFGFDFEDSLPQGSSRCSNAFSPLCWKRYAHIST